MGSGGLQAASQSSDSAPALSEMLSGKVLDLRPFES